MNIFSVMNFITILVDIKNIYYKKYFYFEIKKRKNSLWIIIVMMQYIISLPYHKVEGTIVAQKILICHEKAITLLNTSTYFSFSNFHIFAMQI